MGGNSGVVDEDAVVLVPELGTPKPVNNGASPSSALPHESHPERRSKCLEKLQVLDKALKVCSVLHLAPPPFFSWFRFAA